LLELCDSEIFVGDLFSEFVDGGIFILEHSLESSVETEFVAINMGLQHWYLRVVSRYCVIVILYLLLQVEYLISETVDGDVLVVERVLIVSQLL